MRKYIVKWTSQSRGVDKEKTGEIISFIPANESGYIFLPERFYFMPKSHIKFQEKSKSERVLVQVKAGANKNINHYYAPLRRELERQGNLKVLREFENN